MKINRILTNLCSADLPASKKFYTTLFDLTVAFDSDWFIQLVSENSGLELGIIQADHELIPQQYQGRPAGLYVTFVVDDVTEIFEQATALGYDIVQPPEMTSYGQRRLLLKDPAGILVDVSSVG